MSQFTAHLTRGAATSAAMKAGVTMETMLATADWRQASTFRRFYCCEVQESTFKQAVLRTATALEAING